MRNSNRGVSGSAHRCCVAFFLVVAAVSARALGVEILPYTASIEGVAAPDLLETLARLSDTLNLQDEPPPSMVQLKRRTEADEARFKQILNSFGYFGGSVETTIDEKATPVGVVFQVTPGRQYVVASVEVVRTDAKTVAAAPMPDGVALGLETGRPVLAKEILSGEERLLRLLQESGFASPQLVNREVAVDHEKHEAYVTYRVKTGPKANFGPYQIEGLETVQPVVIERMVTWKQGDLFTREELNETQNRLYRSGLFSSVRVEVGEQPEDARTAIVKITVVERKHRTIAGGLEYRTDEGLAARFRWEHRNLRGLGRRLSIESTLSTLLSELKMEYTRDHFRREDQSLRLEWTLGKEDTDAFESTRMATHVWVERKMNDRLTLGAGLGFRVGEVEQRRRTETVKLLSIPVMAEWDSSDDRLNPTAGFRLSLQLAPYVDIFGGDSRFLKTELNLSHYWQLGGSSGWVLATRLRAGAIFSEEVRNIPPDVRFYSGGGGSVRGYPFQKVGPLVEGDPVGGRSVLEGSVELRRRLSEQFGIAVFVDGGMVYAPSIPDFKVRPRFGAGAGLRYFSPLGPLRFDLAIPLNPPDDVDERFQFYISIGQAF